MTDREISYAKMARQLYRVLTDQRPQWEDKMPGMTANFEQLNNFLEAFEAVAAHSGVKNGAEYTNARDKAEHAAEEAAGLLVRGLRKLQANVPNPALATAAGYTPDQLDPKHGTELLAALNEIAAAAEGVRPLLANEGVTDEQIDALPAAIAVYEPIADLPTTTEAQGKSLGGTAREVTKGLKGVVRQLDEQIYELHTEIPSLADYYDKARQADPNYVPKELHMGVGRNEGGDGSNGGVGPEVAGDAFGPEPKPFV